MKLTIIGASGQGKVVADIAEKNGYDEIVFLDDDPNRTTCGKWRVVGTTKEIGSGDLFIAIGNAMIRKQFMERYEGRCFPALIHPNAVIADDVTIGGGSVVMAGTVINSGATIGKGCIINTCSSVDHDCRLDDFVHLSVGAHLCGTVAVGNAAWIGAGATVSNNVRICGGCMIGAGAVVLPNVDIPGVYVGVPARKTK